MRRAFQLCLRWGSTPIPPSEVLNALGLDENANTVDPDPAAAPPASAVVSSPPADQTADRAYTDPAQLTRVLAAHTDSLAATVEGFTGIAATSLQPGLKRTLDFLKLYKEQLTAGQLSAEMRRLLDHLAAETPQPEDPATFSGSVARAVAKEETATGASSTPPIEPCPPGCIACATDESHDPAPDGSGQP
ncbi:MAG: hypothetical protein HOY75_08130 [Streptomyces sp.]|nr:hypothetical protein [Streptomyces sp.]